MDDYTDVVQLLIETQQNPMLDALALEHEDRPASASSPQRIPVQQATLFPELAESTPKLDKQA